jgi:hypothetical protein
MGLPDGYIIPLLLVVVGLGWLLNREGVKDAVLGDLPPSRRATGISALVLLLGLLPLFLVLPGEDFGLLLPAWWMSASFIMFAAVSLLPDALYRETRVTVAGLIFVLLGAPTVLALGIAALGGGDVESRGAMVVMFLVSAVMT